MKILRVFLFLFVAVVGLLIVAAIFAFNSGVQTWAARRAVASQPDMKAEIGRVSVGFNKVELAGIRLVRPGMILTLPSAEVDVPLVRAAGKKIDVKRIKAHGWTLDLTAPAKMAGAAQERRRAVAGYLAVLTSAQAAPVEKSAAFTGIFAQLKLPVEVSLEEADLAGEIIFPVAQGQPPGKAKVTLTGGQLAGGKEGKFSVSADAELVGGAVSSISARSQIAVRMDTPSSIDRISVVTDAKAVGTQFPSGAKLMADLQAERVGQGSETYRLVLESGGKTLVNLQAQLPAGATRLDGNVVLAVRASDLEPFALGRPIPSFEAKADSKFGAGTTFTEFSAEGSFELHASQLETIQPELKAVGLIKVNSTFAVEYSGSSVRVKTLQMKVNGAQPIATVDARQAFEFNVQTSELRVADPTQDLLAVAIEGVPLAWAQAFLKDVILTGGDVRGAFVARAAGGGFTVRPQSPLVVSQFSVSSAGKPVLRDVSVAVNASGDMSPMGWQAEVTELTVRGGGKTLVTLSAKAGQAYPVAGAAQQPIKATGQFNADIPTILAQPAASAMAFLTKGAASGEFTVSSGAKQEVAAKLVIMDLLATTKEALPKITVDIRADLAPEGRFEATVPLLIEQAGRKSDLTLTATGKTTPAGVQVEARVASTVMYVDDVKILAAPMAVQPAEPAKPTLPSGPDKAPPWAGVSGKITLALEQVVYSPELTIRDVSGTVAIGDAALTLDGIKAVLSTGGLVKADGNVTFTPSSPKPYALKAEVAVADLNSGSIMKALSPGTTTPIVEGKFDLTSQVAGTGPNLGALAEQARGDAKISSKGGVFRPVSSKYIEMFSSARSQLIKRTEQAGTIGVIAGVLGAKLPGGLGSATAKAQMLAERMGEIEAILKLISELKFDQLTLDVGGDTNLNTVLRDLTVTTPELRFVGAGGLKYNPNVPLWKQALTLKLTGGARGKSAEVMKKANLLGPAVDNLGYVPLSVNLEIDGTAEKPDTSKLVSALLEKVVGVKLAPADLVKLRNGDISVLLNLVSQLR